MRLTSERSHVCSTMKNHNNTDLGEVARLCQHHTRAIRFKHLMRPQVSLKILNLRMLRGKIPNLPVHNT
jgi:hypothetical protein